MSDVVVIPMRSRSTVKIIGDFNTPESLPFTSRTKHVLVVPMLGQSRVEGVPTGITGGTPYAGPALGVKTMSSSSFAWVAYGLTDNSVYRSARANTVNFMTELARDYQTEYDANDDLPEIRIINVAYSGSGRSYACGNSNNRWNEHLIKGTGLEPGTIDESMPLTFFDEAVEGSITSDTSLYDAAEKSIRAGIEAIIAEGKTPVLMCSVVEALVADMTHVDDAEAYYQTMQVFSDLIERATGTKRAPMFTFKPRVTATDIYPSENVAIANAKLDEWVSANPHTVALDPNDAVGYVDSGSVTITLDDIFWTDGVHYRYGTYEYLVHIIGKATYGSGLFGQICRI